MPIHLACHGCGKSFSVPDHSPVYAIIFGPIFFGMILGIPGTVLAAAIHKSQP